MIILNGGAGSKGRMAYSCTYFSMFLCFSVVGVEGVWRGLERVNRASDGCRADLVW